MKPVLLLFAFLLVVNCGYAQKQEQYSRAKIYLDANGHSIRKLSALGLAVDHGEYKKNTFFTSDFSASEIEKARKAGFKVEIVIQDVVKYYQQQNKKKAERTTSVSCGSAPPDVPAHFHLGSYAGYFTYDEMLAILDSMTLLYPGLISPRQEIDTFHSIQGVPLYWLRISNNPTVDQPSKPQMLVTALHHAREPGSLSSTIFYLWYLLEHYSTDPQIKSIIDNTELYFVPCVNPDGYMYNYTTSPTGGGMWRKNMRDNLDGTFGVDLNRNYAYEWGYDDIGSSPFTSNDTYRGTAAFSEPETQAIKWFAENHHFELNLNYHTYNNDMLNPWGYIWNLLTVDSVLFSNYGAYITHNNNYRFGTCNQMLDYVANGDSDDWMYGDITSKNKVLAWTPEIGSVDNGFYPPATQIIPDCQNNLQSNINTAALLLPFATIHHTDEKILIQPSGYLHYNLERLGIPDTATFTATILPLDSWLTVPTTPKVYSSLTMMQQVNDSFSYSLNPATPNGQLVSYVLQLNNGYYNVYDTVQFYYGKYYSITAPSTSSLTDWINNGWGVCTSSYYTPPSSIQSSVTGEDNYPDNADITIYTSQPVDLTNSIEAYLDFYAKWYIETNYDIVDVNVSVAGTGTWEPLCGRYTRPEVGGLGIPIYDGQQINWVQEEMNLSDYLGQKILIEYELISDPATNYQGYFFDDVTITTVQDSFNNVGVTKVTNNSPSLVAWPNPASDLLNLSVTSYSFAKPLNAMLYDCLGREAMTITIDRPTVSFDVHQLPSNVYYLKVSGSGTMLPVQKIDIIR